MSTNVEQRSLPERVLITGGRAPVALELARHYAANGHTVFVGDSVWWMPARGSLAVRRCVVLPPANGDQDRYADALLRVIERHNITVIQPTCEEIFFLARLRNRLPSGVTLLAPPFAVLRRLHNKAEFIEWARQLGFAVPATRTVESVAELQAAFGTGEPLVFKPVWSRFASRTVIRPTRLDALNGVVPSPTQPWVVQAFISGQQVCTWSVAREGRLAAHSAYRTEFTAGQGATIHFAPDGRESVREWVARFVAATNFSGQIAFDLIETEGGELWPIECNPRTTSGAHLFRPCDNLPAALLGRTRECIQPAAAVRRMLWPLLVVYGFKTVRSWRGLWRWLAAMFNGRDVMFRFGDPLPALLAPLLVLTLLWRAWRLKLPLHAAATADFEWNGDSGAVMEPSTAGMSQAVPAGSAGTLGPSA